MKKRLRQKGPRLIDKPIFWLIFSLILWLLLFLAVIFHGHNDQASYDFYRYLKDQPHILNGKILTAPARVVDGDTLALKPDSSSHVKWLLDKQGEIKVRLYGINAPEKHEKCLEKNIKLPCGLTSLNNLRYLITDQPVTCYLRKQDRYKRYIAHCFNIHNIDLGTAQIRSSHARRHIY